jgi:hypothetical protein
VPGQSGAVPLSAAGTTQYLDSSNRAQAEAPGPVDSSGLPAEDIELRTFANGQYVGRFMLTPRPGARPSQRARLVAVALSGLVGHAIGDSSAHAA